MPKKKILVIPLLHPTNVFVGGLFLLSDGLSASVSKQDITGLNVPFLKDKTDLRIFGNILHELGHVLNEAINPAHYLIGTNPTNSFDEKIIADANIMRQCGSVFIGTSYDRITSIGLCVTKQVSLYAAAKNMVMDIPSEVFSGLSLGVTFDNTIIAMFNRLGGVTPIKTYNIGANYAQITHNICGTCDAPLFAVYQNVLDNERIVSRKKMVDGTAPGSCSVEKNTFVAAALKAHYGANHAVNLGNLNGHAITYTTPA